MEGYEVVKVTDVKDLKVGYLFDDWEIDDTQFQVTNSLYGIHMTNGVVILHKTAHEYLSAGAIVKRKVKPKEERVEFVPRAEIDGWKDIPVAANGKPCVILRTLSDKQLREEFEKALSNHYQAYHLMRTCQSYLREFFNQGFKLGSNSVVTGSEVQPGSLSGGHGCGEPLVAGGGSLQLEAVPVGIIEELEEWVRRWRLPKTPNRSEHREGVNVGIELCADDIASVIIKYKSAPRSIPREAVEEMIQSYSSRKVIGGPLGNNSSDWARGYDEGVNSQCASVVNRLRALLAAYPETNSKETK